MQATDTATNRDFARKAATAARWAGRALWFVFGSVVRVLYICIISVVSLANLLIREEKPVHTGPGPGPAPMEPGHNPSSWANYYGDN